MVPRPKNNRIILFSDTLQVPTKETACKTVNDQPTVKAKKFQKETFQNASRTVGINAQKTEKKKLVKVSSRTIELITICVINDYAYE